jgi:hypothetical protein
MYVPFCPILSRWVGFQMIMRIIWNPIHLDKIRHWQNSVVRIPDDGQRTKRLEQSLAVNLNIGVLVL